MHLHTVRRPRLALGDGAATRVGFFGDLFAYLLPAGRDVAKDVSARVERGRVLDRKLQEERNTEKGDLL